MIVITGAAGFIGSNMALYLKAIGLSNLTLVDFFGDSRKISNLKNLQDCMKIDRDDFISWLDHHYQNIDFIIHLGARTDTTEFDAGIFEKLNVGYSRHIWEACTRYRIPLVYASSAATYGDGELGYIDDHTFVPRLKPLNPYGESKNNFDKWVLNQKDSPPFWAGLKFFNVYGPGEYHKGRMASVVFHAYLQILQTHKMNLFRSHKAGIENGGQARDFIYVKDVIRVIDWLRKNRPSCGIYNLGTGKARTFLDLTKATFAAMGKEPCIEFIDTPSDIRDKYQYFTEANMNKLRQAGYTDAFFSLEEGVAEYVKEYLLLSSSGR
jgi:ADP-L-glycero-D-manno-heptose 6-epimerase